MASKIQDLLHLSEKELIAELARGKQELFNLRFKGTIGDSAARSGMRNVRKNVARILTLIRERQLGISTPIEAPAPALKKKEKTASIKVKHESLSGSELESGKTKEETEPKPSKTTKKTPSKKGELGE